MIKNTWILKIFFYNNFILSNKSHFNHKIESKRKELIWKYKKLNKMKIINQCESLEKWLIIFFLNLKISIIFVSPLNSQIKFRKFKKFNEIALRIIY